MGPELSGCVLQFAKAPVPGRVKTRLVPALGEPGAARLAARMVTAVSESLDAMPPGWQRVLCVDDPEHALFASLCADGRQPLWTQGEGDLGERMARACRRALGSFAAVMVVGSDCLGYDAAYLQRAVAFLASGVPAVLGPAVDGGYVLIGFRECPDGVFRDMAWGTAAVAALQRERFRESGLAWRELPPRADVDCPQDLWIAEALLDAQA